MQYFLQIFLNSVSDHNEIVQTATAASGASEIGWQCRQNKAIKKGKKIAKVVPSDSEIVSAASLCGQVESNNPKPGAFLWIFL